MNLKKYFFIITGVALAISSCKNPDSVIGLNVQPPADKLVLSIDTVTLETLTVTDTVLRSGNVLNLVGSDYSTVYGKTNASVYSQVVFGTTPTLGQSTDVLYSDSLILRLAYSGFYGDTTGALTIHVYQLAESMSTDSSYNNNKTFATGVELAALTFNPRPATPLTEYGSNIPPQLRIPLPQALADSILSKNLQPELSGNDQWINYFKGIYIKVDEVNGPGCILSFNMASLESKMTLYFHRGTAGDDSLHYDFQFTGARCNRQTHDFAGTAVGNQLADPTVGNALNYIQGAAGVKVKIKMPYISDFAQKSNIAVNRAELIVNKVSTGSDSLAPPDALWLQIMDSAGNAAYIPDQFEGSDFYGGAYNSATGQYTFNLTHYFQDVTKGLLNDYGMYLGVSGAGVLEYYGVIQAGRVAVGSGNATADPATKMKLKLYYTRLN